MPTPEVTASLMHALREGNQEAGRELVDLFYPELRRLAAAQMKNERVQHTWQPSALVHELYLELLKTKGLRGRDYGDCERKAFFALAGQMMKRLLIHHARPLYRRVERVNIADSIEQRDQSAAAIYEVEDALVRLGSIDPKLRTVVEMKVFEGLTGNQIAEQIGCSRRTVGNCWNFARRWLQQEWAGAESVTS